MCWHAAMIVYSSVCKPVCTQAAAACSDVSCIEARPGTGCFVHTQEKLQE